MDNPKIINLLPNWPKIQVIKIINYSAKKLASLDERAFPHYLSGLGYLGLGDKARAKEQFNAALQISTDFLSAKIELGQL